MVSGSCVRLAGRGRAVGFAFVFALAAEHAADGRSPTRSLHRGRRLQINQVIVGLAHPRLLPLVSPPEEQPRSLLKETASALFAVGFRDTQGQRGVVQLLPCVVPVVWRTPGPTGAVWSFCLLWG